MAITTAIAAVASAGAAAYGAYSTSQTQSQMQGMAQGTYNEQQGFAQQLQTLMANPSSVTSLPGYEFQFQQGSDAVTREMAASGFLGSGNEATALTKYGQGMAQSAYAQQEQMLAGLSGLQAASSPAQYGSVGLSAGNSAFSQLGQAFSSLGYGLGQYNMGPAFTPEDMSIMASGGPSPTMPMGNYTVNTPW